MLAAGSHSEFMSAFTAEVVSPTQFPAKNSPTLPPASQCPPSMPTATSNSESVNWSPKAGTAGRLADALRPLAAEGFRTAKIDAIVRQKMAQQPRLMLQPKVGAGCLLHDVLVLS
eukprot:SAG31_NODE_5264_length_2644_cov_1.197250_1_plen_115_part_00